MTAYGVPGLPERVTIYEVGPRDGLQNESAIVPVEAKAEFVRRLVSASSTVAVVQVVALVDPLIRIYHLSRSARRN